MKRIVFLSLFSALLSLFVSSVGAVAQKKTLRIENRNRLDARVAYCYVVDDTDDDRNRIGERAGFHVEGWVRVPSGRSVKVTYPATNYDLYVIAELSDGEKFVPTKGGPLGLLVHLEKDFKVLQDRDNGDLHYASAKNNGIYYQVGEKDLKRMEFRTFDKPLLEIPGSMPLNFDGDYDTRGFSRQGTDYALLFATNEYDHWNNLATPIADAEAIGAELKNRYGFKVDIRKNVTIKEVLAALAEYKAKRYDRGDQLLVYFAGHGEFDPVLQDGTIAGKDSELKTTDANLSTYVYFSKLRESLDIFPCERIMLILDVCHGGTFDEDIAVGGQQPENQYLRDRGFTPEDQYLLMPQDTLKLKTRWYISSGGNEKVKDGLSHSPFAAALLTLLKNRDNRDGVLTVPEIRRQMPSQLEDELNKLRGLQPNEIIKQTPAFGPFGSGVEADPDGVEADPVFLLIKSESK